MCITLQTPENLKSRIGEEAFNDDGLVQRSIRLLKDDFPDLEVILYLSLTHKSSESDIVFSQPRATTSASLQALQKSFVEEKREFWCKNRFSTSYKAWALWQ